MRVITNQTASQAFWSAAYKSAKKAGRDTPNAQDFGLAAKEKNRILKIVVKNKVKFKAKKL